MSLLLVLKSARTRSAAIGSNRLCPIKAFPSIIQYVEDLLPKTDVSYSDEILLYFVELHISTAVILEEIHSDGSIMLEPEEWEKKYSDFKRYIPEHSDVLSKYPAPLFGIHYHTIIWYMHEVYRKHYPRADRQGSHQTRVSQPQDSNLVLQSIEGIFNAFLFLNTDKVGALPVSAFAKVARAGATLLRMCASEKRNAGLKYAAIRAVIDRKYLTRVRVLLRSAAGTRATIRSYAAMGFEKLFAFFINYDHNNLKPENSKLSIRHMSEIPEHWKNKQEAVAGISEAVRILFEDEQPAFICDDVFFDVVEKLEKFSWHTARWPRI
ncbi:MAG: hypothetical protein Q9164_006723 [Protoblastenia rupestris]